MLRDAAQRRSNTILALTCALLDLFEAFVDFVQGPGLADHRVRPGAWIAYTSARSLRVPTMEPMTVMPFSTVSKIGRLTKLSAGRATKTSVPPRRSDAEGLLERLRRDRHRDGGMSAAERLDRRDRVLDHCVDDVVGAEFLCQFELLVD